MSSIHRQKSEGKAEPGSVRVRPPAPLPTDRVRPPAPPPTENTENVTELACKLQSAIERSDTDAAATLAAQLAKQRAPLSVKKTPTNSVRDLVRVKVHIEDQHRKGGHVIISIYSAMSVNLLKNQFFQSFGFPPEVQKWVIGRRLAQDTDLLCDLIEVTAGSSLFLYLMSAQAVGLTRRSIPHEASTSNHVESETTGLMIAVPPVTSPPPCQHHQGGQRPSNTAAPSPVPRQRSGWTCSRCTYAENQPTSPSCELCQHSKPRFSFPTS